MTLISRMRDAIHADHEAIERTAFSQALMTGRIARADYLLGIAQLHVIHEALESHCDRYPQVEPYFSDPMRRAATIQRDVEQLGSRLRDYAHLPPTHAIQSQMKRCSTAEPLSLIGCIYILEGSRMGSLMLAKPIAAALGVSASEGQGIDYHLEGAGDVPSRLRSWKAFVNESDFASDVRKSIEDSACQFMSCMVQLYRALPIEQASSPVGADRAGNT